MVSKPLTRRHLLGVLAVSGGCLDDQPRGASLERPLQAHRCFGEDYPENTVYAARQAARIADRVEFDVRRCGSGELVVFHDKRVDALTDGRGLVADLSLAELRSLSVLGSGEPVPSLREFLAAVPRNTGLNVDLKEAGIAAEAMGMAFATHDDVVVSSLTPEFLEEAASSSRAAAVDLTLVGVGTVGLGFSEGVDTALELGCDRVHLGYGLIANTDAVPICHDYGLTVGTGTLRTSEHVKTARRTTVDGFSGATSSLFP